MTGSSRRAAAGVTKKKGPDRGSYPAAARYLALLAVAAVVGGWMVLRGQSGSGSWGAMGPVDGCRKGPRFQSELGLGQRAAIGTSLSDIKGLAIVDPDGNGGQGTVYQHESWDDAGYLGPFLTDRQGNIYVAPVPLVSLLDNPPELQNRVYRVDTDTQAMSLFVELPPGGQPGGGSPFGVVGLAYDCETDSLYASSLAGSTGSAELGRIFRIDIGQAAVKSHLDGVDALGVGVFRGSSGKRLYYGLGRKSEVRSIALDARGDFVGESRTEFTFTDKAQGARRTVRRIRFLSADEAAFNVFEFNYSLKMRSERIEDVMTYRYDAASDTWTYKGTRTE